MTNKDNMRISNIAKVPETVAFCGVKKRSLSVKMTDLNYFMSVPFSAKQMFKDEKTIYVPSAFTGCKDLKINVPSVKCELEWWRKAEKERDGR